MDKFNKKFRVGIDMRMAGEGFGIGRYITELTLELLRKKNHDYILFFDEHFSKPAYTNFSQIHADCKLISAKYYSLEEQVFFPFILKNEHLDLIHFPNFNVPIFCPVPYVTTIHDLIHHRFPGRKKRNILHRIAYRAIIRNAVRSAAKIIAVSQVTKNDIIKLLDISPEKISVIYEGVSADYQKGTSPENDRRTLAQFGILKPYVLAVGVWRRYKNFPFLASAFADVKNKLRLPHQLVIIGEEDKSYPEIKQQTSGRFSGTLLAPGKVPAFALPALYRSASCFVNPSLSEGFGLTTIEAQACGTPVLASDIPVSKEILGDSALFFDPQNAQSLSGALQKVLTQESDRQALGEKGYLNSQNYRWKKAAQETEHLYQQILSHSK